MKSKTVLSILLTVAAVPRALGTPVSFSFASAPGDPSTSGTGGQISFGGKAASADAGTSTFNFLNATGGTGNGYTFEITDGALNGLFGKIDGSWTIGAVTSDGDSDSADVTGNPGTFTVYQDATHYVQAQINFFTIETILSMSLGGVSGNGTLNVSGWTSTGGLNSSLVDLISETSGTSSVGFTFDPNQTLRQLVTSKSPQATSFNGTLATQPTAMAEPSELAFLGIELSGLGALLFLFRRHMVAK